MQDSRQITLLSRLAGSGVKPLIDLLSLSRPVRSVSMSRGVYVQMDIETWLAAHPYVRVRVRSATPRPPSFDVGKWLADCRRHNIARAPVPTRLPVALPFMCNTIAMECREPGAWVSDALCGHGILAAAVLNSAWVDARWSEEAAEARKGGLLAQSLDSRSKRRRRVRDRMSGIGFFMTPAAPNAWGWCPTLEGWCAVIGIDAEHVRVVVAAHLRAMSPEHAELVDFISDDLCRARPDEFWNRSARSAKRWKAEQDADCD